MSFLLHTSGSVGTPGSNPWSDPAQGIPTPRNSIHGLTQRSTSPDGSSPIPDNLRASIFLRISSGRPSDEGALLMSLSATL